MSKKKKIPELESYHLGVGSGSHREQTAEMLKRREEDVDIAAMHLKKTLEELA